MENNHGGKRPKTGRKPLPEKRKNFTLRLKISTIERIQALPKWKANELLSGAIEEWLTKFDGE